MAPAPPNEPLDWRVILRAPLLIFAPWLASVLVLTWAGYPGVVCVTPVAWLVAGRVGLEVEAQSANTQPQQRVFSAALAGAWFGVLQSVLFWVIVPRMGPIQLDERANAIGLGLAMLVCGAPITAAVSACTAYFAERRQRAMG